MLAGYLRERAKNIEPTCQKMQKKLLMLNFQQSRPQTIPIFTKFLAY
jgi:hypothetical protein